MVLLLRLIPSAGHDKLLLTYGLALALGAGWLFEQVGLNANLGRCSSAWCWLGNRSTTLYDRLWALQ